MRAVRGGSWINNPDNARADNRNRNNPDNRNNNLGFRVLSASHIPMTRFRNWLPTKVCNPRSG
ncbi:MAG: SUMF1/EgtB/PvdO family nonheme iron enzyme [Halieaceae bacterium]|nr:SUMF1/EgtB/PvdO family nonheme iron enzyme [Halieaceae bacterium]MCP4995676.1 SUMF1/EgtB/PvdO family nonheme iron enzyme [Gammaproteobacteria bacterium]